LSTRGNEDLPSVASIGERGLIDRIRSRFPAPPGQLVVGIGDDAAVAAPERGALQVLTIDALVEGVHFDLQFSSFHDVGYKALAVNVSDVAAMGGTSRFALLSLILPGALAVSEIDALLDGFARIASDLKITLAGGNVTSSPGPLVVDVSVVGWVKPRRILTRGGGRPGDELYVTGLPGAAAAGLGWLRAHAAGPDDRPDDPQLAECVARYRRPEPRARLGAILGRSRAASACMDLSDGLADAVTQIARASGAGAEIDAAALPLHPGAVSWFEASGEDPVTSSLAGGDDYELLFTVPPRARGRFRAAESQARGLPVTRIGKLTDGPDIVLRRNDRAERLPSGYVHF
jgi:thiamine-monophosphate kinase